ncbi:MAG TPA: IPT/TIG domain-containing protein [Bryobacteraceae bacterium]|nr:IPT/TIG domain-containing protein [Bryobacteraceae bacterium]
MVTDSRPRISPGCPVNAASYVGGGVAPGEIVTIFGAAMGPSETVPLSLTGNGRLDTTLAGTRILFNGAPAPLLYVSDTQSSAIVPFAVSGPSVDVQVEYQGLQSDAVTVPVLPSRPGVFSLDGSGQGPLAILNDDGTVNSPSNPAARGSIVTIYATGGGERDPAVADGQILSDVLPKPSLGTSVWFDNGPQYDISAYGEVLYAGGSPGSVAGLLQLNVRVPPDALAGDAVAFGLIIGGERAPGPLTIALR